MRAVKCTFLCSYCNSCENQNTPELTSTNYFLQRSNRKKAEKHTISFCPNHLYIFLYTESSDPSEAAPYSNQITVQKATTEILYLSILLGTGYLTNALFLEKAEITQKSVTLVPASHEPRFKKQRQLYLASRASAQLQIRKHIAIQLFRYCFITFNL